MTVVYDPAAAQESQDAIDYYAAILQRLSGRFLDDMEAAINRIVDMPGAWPAFRGGLRRCLLSVFPYRIIYRVEGGIIRVFAVAHLRRRPGYWRKRIE
jgi:plasmid stabilization system protein ParE